MEPNAVARLAHKNAQEAIVARIAEDLRLTPFLAHAYYEQMAQYFEQYAGLDLHDNQVAYCAVADTEPPGRKLAECQRVPVRLTLHDPADLDSAAIGLAALRPNPRHLPTCAQSIAHRVRLGGRRCAGPRTAPHPAFGRPLP